MNFTASLKFVTTCAGLFLLAALSLGQDSTSITKTKKPYFVTGNEATLSGTVNLNGWRPRRLLIDTTADPACRENLETEWFEGAKGKLANVIVYAKSEMLDGLTFEPPTSIARLEHRNCRYVPHVMAIQVGQKLMISNTDSTIHNTHPTPKYNPEWNQTQPVGSAPIITIPELPEVAMPIKDNQHPWENAYVGVFAHPFFGVTDRYGNFKIGGLPPGTYTLTARHERLGEKTIELVLVPGEARHVTFDFEARE